jgi:hypothetical protein
MEEGNPLKKKKIHTPRPISSRRKGLIEREQEGKALRKIKMEKETVGRNNNKHERKKERKQASKQA